jgi:MFS family permease
VSDTASATASATGPWATFKESPRAIRFLLLGVCVNQFGAFLQAFLVVYLVDRGFGKGQAGFALGAYGVGSVIGVLLGGGLTDRLAPRTTIILSMLGAAGLTLSISFLGYYPAIVVAVLLAGVATQSYRPAAAALLTGMVMPSRQVMVMAMNRLAMNVGMLVGPLAAAALAGISWNLVFWTDAATSLLYAGVAVFLLPSTAGTTASDEPDAGAATTATGGGYRPMLADRRFVVFLGSMLVNALVHIQLLAVLPLTLRDAGYPTVVYSVVLVLGTALVVGAELLVTKATQRWPAYRAAALGSLLFGLGTLGYGLRGGLVVIALATVVHEVGQMIAGPTVFAWPAKAAPEGMAGRYLGATLAMFGLGQAVGAMLGPLAYSQVGNGFWVLCAAMTVVSALACRQSMRPPAPVRTVRQAPIDDPSPVPAVTGAA